MVDFGITSAWDTIIPSVERFLAVGFLLTLTLLAVTTLFARYLMPWLMDYMGVELVDDSMRNLQPDENKHFIRAAMKPHYHGYTRIGYVEKMKYGVHMFNPSGQIKGITGSEEKAREYLRGVYRVSRNYANHD